MKKAQWLSLAALVTAGFITLLGCPTPTAPGGGGGGGGTTVPDVVFADSNISYYLGGETRTTQPIMIAGWEGTGTPYRDDTDGSLKVVFEHYPSWWGGGVGIVQKPEGSTGYYDLTNVAKIRFQIKSADITPNNLKFMLQWLSSTDGYGGEYVIALDQLNITDITDWTTVEVDLSTVTNTVRYGKTSVDFNTAKDYVDTGMAIVWGNNSVAGDGTVSGDLTAGQFYNIKDIQFIDANGNNVNFYSNIQ
ncbi:MAG: hypothetical protein ACOZCE_01610 [Spirochaetota bacterium]